MRFGILMVWCLAAIQTGPAHARGIMTLCDDPERLDFVQLVSMPGLQVDVRARTDFLRQDAAFALMSASELAQRDGYTIIIQSACRSSRRQIQLARMYPSSVGTTIARPGRSRHGHGIAVDATLGDAHGRDLIGLNMNSHGQCGLPPAKMRFVARLSRYFFAAGWKRLVNESWHFEYGTNDWRVAKCSGYASLCGKTGPNDCTK